MVGVDPTVEKRPYVAVRQAILPIPPRMHVSVNEPKVKNSPIQHRNGPHHKPESVRVKVYVWYETPWHRQREDGGVLCKEGGGNNRAERRWRVMNTWMKRSSSERNVISWSTCLHALEDMIGGEQAAAPCRLHADETGWMGPSAAATIDRTCVSIRCACERRISYLCRRTGRCAAPMSRWQEPPQTWLL